mmetsp:Transcript_21816/g.26679  ORF Transcript_21816/g.26679 Transcript_21816/m.26679 type:complete len:123 (+) Transcript_21816:24-392(+)
MMLPTHSCSMPHNYAQELGKGINVLRQKRDEILQQISQDEGTRNKLQKDLEGLTERLSVVNESIAIKSKARVDYDNTIHETETAYKKIMESSQTLLHVLRREAINLDKKLENSTYSSPLRTE